MLYVLHGPDQVRAREELQKIRTGLDRDGNLAHNTVRLEARGLSPADLRAACHVASFFVEDRLIIVEGLQQRFSGARRRSSSRATTSRASRASTAASDFDQFVDVLTHLPDTTTVVLLDEQPQVAFLDAISAAATVKEFPVLRPNELRVWAEARVKAQGGTINPQALDRLLTLIDGAHIGELANEIDKLVTYVNGRRIEGADIDELVSSALQYQVWDLTDAVVAGRADRALSFVETQARQTRDFASQYLFFMITRQYRQIMLAKAMLDEHMTQQEIGQRLGIFSSFPLRKVIEQAGRYSTERLDAAYRRLLETDVAVKTGVLDVDTALELLIADLCELAKPPPRRTPVRR